MLLNTFGLFFFLLYNIQQKNMSNIISVGLAILLGIITAILILYIYIQWIKWANTYYDTYDNQQLQVSLQVYNSTPLDIIYGKLLPSRSVKDSYKFINFWTRYYYIRWTI